MKKEVTLILLLLLLVNQMYGQDDFCYNGNILSYSVISSNGVNMRIGKSLNREIIQTIPNNAILSVCSNSIRGRNVIIANKKGTWLFCKYNLNKGYVFSSYLKINPCYFPTDQIIFLNDNGVDLSRNRIPISCEVSYGIYITDTAKSEFVIKEIRLIDTFSDYTKMHYGKLNETDNPWIIIQGNPNVSGSGKFVAKRKMFLPGELYNIEHPVTKEKFSFYCSGIVGIDTVFKGIKSYKLIMNYGNNEQLKVAEFDLFAWNYGNYEGGIWIQWIGDIDDDGKVEIIIKTQSNYRGWEYYLIRKKNDKYEIVPVGGGSSC